MFHMIVHQTEAQMQTILQRLQTFELFGLSPGLRGTLIALHDVRNQEFELEYDEKPLVENVIDDLQSM